MQKPLKVGVIGDYHPASRFHAATNAAVDHAAGALALSVEVAWLPTLALAEEGHESALIVYDALWCAPGSPYQSMAGALQAIRFARERGRPFIGT